MVTRPISPASRRATAHRTTNALSRSLAGAQGETHGVDGVFVMAMLALTALGLIMTYSTTYYWSYLREGDPLAIFGRQVLFAGLGLVLFMALSRFDYGHLRRWSVVLMALCLLMLLLVALIGADRFNARRSLVAGSVQPSEAAKIIILIYAASWLASRRDQVRSITNGLAPFGVIIGIGAGLIVIQPDLSTTLVIVLAAGAMFFVAGASLSQVALVGAIAALAFLGLVRLFPHATARLDSFLLSLSDPNSQAHYHIQQALIAFGEGGLLGRGIGAGYQKFGLLPTPHTDSVFAVLAEEMGWLGIVVTLGLFVLLAWRAARIAYRADTAFGAFLGIGITTWIIGQTMINLLAMTALFPLPGVPVPFLSLGGSSLVSVMAACGILVSISRGTRLPVDTPGSNNLDEIEGNETERYRATTHFRRRDGRPRSAGVDRFEKFASDRSRALYSRSRLRGGGPVRWRA
ncbi:MAG: putative peptidoglycan glycosyltransferase FtsW [Anaerolineae bacterium]|nr:FtsW/RodA/SpoVE family cell cycle protein [Thermoflexales bacterium]MDW8406694.1 putative peptidoglycan glycosyltransferase FtsW [Anaerolineae bacterium]